MIRSHYHFGIFAAALAAAAPFLLGHVAHAQTFTVELIATPDPLTGAKIKSISDDKGLLVEQLDNQSRVFGYFHYPFSVATNSYPTQTSLFLSGLDATGLRREGGYVLGAVSSRAALLDLTNLRAPLIIHPRTYQSSSPNAAANGFTAGWSRPDGGTRHATVWEGVTGFHSDQHPFITQALGADWISSEWRGLEPNTAHRYVGSGTRRGIPGNRAIAYLGSYVELHPQGFMESEANSIYDNFQSGWGRDASGLRHAILWQGTAASFVSLNPAGYGDCRAAAMNVDGIVGRGNLGPVDHALFWKRLPTHPKGFAEIDLHQFLPAGSAESTATGITSGGIIAGHFQVNNVWKPVLWHPIHLTSLTLSGVRILGGVSTTATVRISAFAPVGGVTVTLAPQFGPLLSTQIRTVTIPAGQNHATFKVYSRSVSVPTQADIWATLGHEQQVASLILDTFRQIPR